MDRHISGFFQGATGEWRQGHAGRRIGGDLQPPIPQPLTADAILEPLLRLGGRNRGASRHECCEPHDLSVGFHPLQQIDLPGASVAPNATSGNHFSSGFRRAVVGCRNRRSAAYSSPRVIHRSEESLQTVLPAAAVNNSAAGRLPAARTTLSLTRKTRSARLRIARLDARRLDTVLRAGRGAGPQRILSGRPPSAGLPISPSTGPASVSAQPWLTASLTKT